MLSQNELLLYYFLITVADRNGISFYDYQRICQFLKLDLDDYINARNLLCKRSLIAFEHSTFQVLTLPENSQKCVHFSAEEEVDPKKQFQALKQILKNI
jgi:hypothetical protein